MKKLYFLIFYIFLIGLMFSSAKIVNAETLFQDNFNSNSISPSWVIFTGPEGFWNTINGESVEGSVVKNSSSDTFSYLVAGDSAWNNYTFSTKLMGISGVDKKIMIRYQNPGTRYDISMISGTGVFLQKWQGGIATGLWSVEFGNSNLTWYNIKIEAVSNIFNIFVDEDLKLTVTDSINPILSGKIGLQIWPGNYPGGNRTTTRYDDVLVCDFEGPCEMPTITPTPTPTVTPSPTNTPTPTPTITPTPTVTPTPTPSLSQTPTPTSTPLSPIILIPGLGSSWNNDEIIHGKNKKQSEWYKPFFATTYDGLIKTLKNSGYQENKNLFVFYYDWLQPIEKSAADLKSYINKVVKPSSGVKINLIGHSLGGLVGRAYVQNNPNSNQVEKLITLGTPHKGAPQVYNAWEGANLNNLLGPMEQIGAGLILQLQGFNYPNDVQAIRNLVPSLKDIIFIDNYLKKQNGEIINESSLKQKNTWLKNLGLSTEVNNLAYTIVGTNLETPRWLKVKPQSLTDRILGRWEDGKPISQENSSGDGTVLEESAKINNTKVITLNNFDHGDIVMSVTGQQKILDILGLTSSKIVPQTDNFQEPVLVFALASPAIFKVIDPDENQVGAKASGNIIPNALYSSTEKMIIIPNYKSGKYQVNVTSFCSGEYKLIIGQINSDNNVWINYKDSKSKNFTINIDKSFKLTPEFLVAQINTKLDQLISELPKKHSKSIFAGIIKFRLEKIRESLKEESFNKNKKKDTQIKIVENAIKEMDNSISFAQLKNIDTIIPNLREIMNLLAQVYDLLENNSI